MRSAARLTTPLLFATVGVAAIASLACSRARAPVPPPVPMERQAVESVLEGIEREQSSVRRYQAFVRIRGRAAEGSFDARLVVMFERPNRMRVELLGAFGSTRWTSVTSDSGILVVFPKRREYVRENDVGEVVGTLLGIPLEAEEVMAIFSGGGVPQLPPAGARGVSVGELSRLNLENGVEIEVSADGQVVKARTSRYEVTYPTSWRRRRRQVPDRIAVMSEQLRATLSIEDVDVNVELDGEAFTLTAPPDGQRLRPAQIEGEAVFVMERKPDSGGDPR